MAGLRWSGYLISGAITLTGLCGYVAVRGFGWVPRPDDIAAILFIFIALIGLRLMALHAVR
jgi:hypothetical protein